MLVTVSTIAQLPQALTLGSSFQQHHPDLPFVIGLADDPARLPVGWQSPYPLLTLADAGFAPADIAALSERYTPTAFRAACKPALIRAAYARFFQSGLLYADPSAYVFAPLTNLFAQVATHSLSLNPHWLTPPTDDRQPDEKYLQNVGLFSSGFIGFGRQPETQRMLDWWHERTQQRAHLDPCHGQCHDQLWLMLVPHFFEHVDILKEPGLQVALWNLPERTVCNTPSGWQVSHEGQNSPLLTADCMGLLKRNEGYFQQQNRLNPAKRTDILQLLDTYRLALNAASLQAPAGTFRPVYGQQPEPVVRIGWRRNAAQTLSRLQQWIDTVPVRPVHR